MKTCSIKFKCNEISTWLRSSMNTLQRDVGINSVISSLMFECRTTVPRYIIHCCSWQVANAPRTPYGEYLNSVVVTGQYVSAINAGFLLIPASSLFNEVTSR